MIIIDIIMSIINMIMLFFLCFIPLLSHIPLILSQSSNHSLI